ncbi:phospholipase D-like domain-containing protein [Streptomyces sp. NPDC047085]|uniref:phospholipase D-like domain-containing protein n=1 Tax=Streptomyces sp. NPDC047085 TaxID=3155140 RepID=UPI0033C4BAEF
MEGPRPAGVALAAGTAVVATAVPANAASYSAFAFSRTGSQPTVYDFVNSATSTLDMTIYELEDTTAVNDLIALRNKGVTVRVILDRQHQSANSGHHPDRHGRGPAGGADRRDDLQQRLRGRRGGLT